jgi:ribosomal protein S1
MEVDRWRHRISLSLKNVPETLAQPEAEVAPAWTGMG